MLLTPRNIHQKFHRSVSCENSQISVDYSNPPSERAGLKTCKVLPGKDIFKSAFFLFNFIHKFKNKPRHSLYRLTGYVYAALKKVY